MSSEVRVKTSEEVDSFVMRCMTNFRYFSRSCLKIKTKSQGISPLVFNRAQDYLNHVVEEMIRVHGKVRIIIVKGRQQGLSTWVEARGYWKAIHNEGTKVYILTHEGDATKNLFAMAKRYHENCPVDIRPTTKRSNLKEMIFSDMESEYAVGTAKTGDTGRSQSMQFFHGSEVDYWPDPASIADGALQGLPEEPGTECYLESTVQGVGGFFHVTWMNAMYPDETVPAGWNGYIRVFIPWFWDEGYRTPVSPGFVLEPDEEVLAKAYGWDAGQVNWRRLKIEFMEGDVARFNREYPACPEDAFNASSYNVLIKAELVVQARNNGKLDMYHPTGAKVLGIDVAREGDDDTAFVIRQGRVCERIQKWPALKTSEIVARAIRWKKEYKIDFISIDMTGGYGAGAYDGLVDLGLGRILTGINFASNAIDEVKYKNRRTEMWVTARDWLEAGAQIPDSDEFQTDLCSVQYTHNIAKDLLELEPKKKTKARLNKSPDYADALCLTFYRPNVSLDQGAGAVDSIDPQSFFGDSSYG